MRKLTLVLTSDRIPFLGIAAADTCLLRYCGETVLTRFPRIRHAKKPDRDNLDKALMDSLTGLLWIDDAQVCDGRITKWIAAGDEQPHVVVTLSEVE